MQRHKSRDKDAENIAKIARTAAEKLPGGLGGLEKSNLGESFKKRIRDDALVNAFTEELKLRERHCFDKLEFGPDENVTFILTFVLVSMSTTCTATGNSM